MAVPKSKTSKAKTRTRRAHDALTAPSLSICAHCGASHLPHRVCLECGWYGPADTGRIVLPDTGQETD